MADTKPRFIAVSNNMVLNARFIISVQHLPDSNTVVVKYTEGENGHKAGDDGATFTNVQTYTVNLVSMTFAEYMLLFTELE